jgi:hypothetical protein
VIAFFVLIFNVAIRKYQRQVVTIDKIHAISTAAASIWKHQGFA